MDPHGYFGRNYYLWRRMTAEQREQVLALRKAQNRPWHSPPHTKGSGRFLLSGTCYEHKPIVGRDTERMAHFENELLDLFDNIKHLSVHAWILLPNHYHVLVDCTDVAIPLKELGKLHGRTSRYSNKEEGTPGRKVWFCAFERPIKSDRHYHAMLNYVHNNAVSHGYAEYWQEWPFSSANSYLEEVGRDAAMQHWLAYDISGMGGTWDP